MSDNNKKPEKRYILCWKIKFTLLEDYILKAIEEKKGCSDNEIAEILCLKAEDVSFIISDNGIIDYVQGDSSRRTLISNFTRMEFSIITGEKHETTKRHYCESEFLKYFEELHKLKYKSVPENIQSQKADEYYELNQKIDMPDNMTHLVL